MEAYKAWFILYFTLGVWTCFTLAFYKQGSTQFKFLMSFLIFLLLTPAIDAYSQLILTAPIHWLYQCRINLTWVYGPIMFLLVQTVLLKPITKLSIAAHLSPYFLLCLGQITGELFTSMWIVPVLFFQVFSYLIYSGYLLLQHQYKIKNLVTQHSNNCYYWMLYLIVGLVVAMSVDLVIISLLVKQVSLSSELLNIYASLLGLFICIISIFSVTQPAFLTQNLPMHDTPSQLENSEAQLPIRELCLSQTLVITLTERLQHLIQTEHIHLDSDMSLPKLASKLEISTHQLSELLNVHLGTNFYDFLNQHRFLVAQSLLKNKNNGLTVSDIVYQAGFNNRSSFYKVFKQKTGLTPSQFKKLQKMY